METHQIKLERYKNGHIVEMREPKVRDLLAVGSYQKEEEKELGLIANLTGLNTEELQDLYLSDYKKLQDKLKSFLL